MLAWWENFWAWFGGLEPPAQIAAVVAAVATLGGAAKWLKDNFGAKPKKDEPSIPPGQRLTPPPMVIVNPPAAPAHPVKPTPGHLVGQYLDLKPEERALVDQAIAAFRVKAAATKDAALSLAVEAAEAGRGGDLIARAEAEYARFGAALEKLPRVGGEGGAGGEAARSRGEAAWRLAGLVYPEDKLRALALYREAATLSPAQPAAWLGLARAEAARGDQAAASKALVKAEALGGPPLVQAAVAMERAQFAAKAADAQAARSAAESAVALWRPLAAAPGAAGEEAQSQLARALGLLGAALVVQGDRVQAKARLGEASALAADLAHRRPSNTELAWAAGAALDRLTDLDDDEDEEIRAQREEALTAHQALPAEDPESKRNAAVSLIKLGDSLRARGEIEQAAARYAEALTSFDALAAADPANAQARRDRAVALERLGDSSLAKGDLAAARARYEANLSLRQALASGDQPSAEARRDLALSRIKLADLGRAQGDPGARIQYLWALDLARGLAESDPTSVSAAHLLALALDRAALGASDQEARGRYEEILNLLKPFAAEGRLSPDQAAIIAAVEAHVKSLPATPPAAAQAEAPEPVQA